MHSLSQLAALVGSRVSQFDGPAALGLAARVAALRASADPRLVVLVGIRGWRVFPVDLAAVGIALTHTLFVELHDSAAVLRAIDVLLRSGCFATVVVDAPVSPPLGAVHRYMHICERKKSALIFVAGRVRSLIASAVAIHLGVHVDLERKVVVAQALRSRVPLGPIEEAFCVPDGVY